MSTTLIISGQEIATELRDVAGQIITPDDPGYDEARQVFVSAVDRRPAVIVRPVNSTDVASVVRFARDSGLQLAVRGGGHSMAGYGVCDDGIVLDMSTLKGIHVDVEGRTARAEAGLTVAEYTREVGQYGFATGFGDMGSVGIVGITLGGGVGYLSRKVGLTIDSLLGAEIVTADGELIKVDEQSHPDLFWAIRGGGGNFGVVTSLTFGLVELPTVISGALMLPATAANLSQVIALADSAPDELSVIANVMAAPPMPAVPDEVHGQRVIWLELCWSGDVRSAGVVEELRAIAPPILDTVRPIAYAEIFPSEGHGGKHPGSTMRTLFLDRIDEAVAQDLLDRLDEQPMTMVQIRVMGGAIARVPADATAYAHRQSSILINLIAIHPAPQLEAAAQAWVARTVAAITQTDRGAYLNFLGDEGAERVRAAYPGETWDRLVEVKRRYDPANLFRGNQNIPPA